MLRSLSICVRAGMIALLGSTMVAPAAAEDDYEADVAFALDALEESCGHFFELKDIDWKKVRKEFGKAAEEVESVEQHLVLLVRLLARLEDGHAAVRPTDRTREVRWPDPVERTGAGMFWCRVGKKVYVKSTWNAAQAAGLEPGMEVLKVDGVAVGKWLEARRDELADTQSFSTDHQADFFTLHQGLAQPAGTVLELEVKTTDNKRKKRSVSYSKAATAPWGPAVFPEGLEGDSDLSYGTIEGEKPRRGDAPRYGYVHVRRCKGDLPQRMDAAIAALGDVDGMILDFRGNSGGGFDHDDLLGRFVPAGQSLSFAKTYPSTGEHQYAGRVVVVVDGTVRSAGETGSGMFKEDGRAYMIGESPTAGMSASKTTLPLPSGLFELYVSVASNKGRFNDGRGIEGIGVIPHELVEYDPKDLAAGKDTLIERAKELLQKWPEKAVPYRSR